MADQPQSRLELSDFPGLILFIDSGDEPPGAAVEQTNVNSLVLGQLQVRRGYSQVEFEQE